MQQELIRLQKSRGTGILFVTHNIDEALLLGQKIVIIENGQVKREFSIERDSGERDLLAEPFLSLKREIIQQLDL